MSHLAALWFSTFFYKQVCIYQRRGEVRATNQVAKLHIFVEISHFPTRALFEILSSPHGSNYLHRNNAIAPSPSGNEPLVSSQMAHVSRRQMSHLAALWFSTFFYKQVCIYQRRGEVRATNQVAKLHIFVEISHFPTRALFEISSSPHDSNYSNRNNAWLLRVFRLFGELEAWGVLLRHRCIFLVIVIFVTRKACACTHFLLPRYFSIVVK